MKKYKVVITETLQRVVEIETNSQEEAIEIANKNYENEEIVLDSSDYVDTLFEIATPSQDIKLTENEEE